MRCMIVFMSMSMGVSIAMLSNSDIKVRSLLTNGYVQHSLTGGFGSQFKMEHTSGMGMGCRFVTFTSGPEQYACLARFQWLKTGQRCSIERDACFLAHLKTLVLQKELSVMSVGRKTVNMEMFLVNIGIFVSVACASAQGNHCNKN
jgi:hypothetical protein